MSEQLGDLIQAAARIGEIAAERVPQLMRPHRPLQRVQSGEYASESEVVREGLRALWARDQAVQAWLKSDVAEAYDALVADPSRGVSADELRARLISKGAAAP